MLKYIVLEFQIPNSKRGLRYGVLTDWLKNRIENGIWLILFFFFSCCDVHVKINVFKFRNKKKEDPTKPIPSEAIIGASG